MIAAEPACTLGSALRAEKRGKLFGTALLQASPAGSAQRTTLANKINSIARVAAQAARPVTGAARVVQPDKIPAEYRAAQMAARQTAKVEGGSNFSDFIEGLGNAMGHFLHIPGF